jgi:hypothetical protein
MSDTTKIYELKISLSGIKPTIYRTIQIEKNRTFFELHAAIQIAFGWGNSHMHIFEIGDDRIGMSDFDEFEDDHTIEEKTIRLFQTGLNEKDKFEYIYDFGDHWVHEIQVTKILEPKKTFYPKCIKGSMNRPPEDCGGIYGFEDFKEIMGNRKHSEFKDMKTWYGGMYDEELFSKDQINKDFKSFDTIVEEMLLDLVT